MRHQYVFSERKKKNKEWFRGDVRLLVWQNGKTCSFKIAAFSLENHKTLFLSDAEVNFV